MRKVTLSVPVQFFGQRDTPVMKMVQVFVAYAVDMDVGKDIAQRNRAAGIECRVVYTETVEL